MPVFYPGQTDYIDRLNELATANQVIDIAEGLETVDAAVATAQTAASEATLEAGFALDYSLAADASASTATTQANLASTKANEAAQSAVDAAEAAADSQYWAGVSTAGQLQSDWTQTNNVSKDFIKNKPALGTASTLDVPPSGNASATQVVKGNDTRLSDARAIALTGSTAGQIPVWNGSAWAVGSITPGLANFTESLSTASPNNTINAARLIVNVASTNGDLILSPKGTGAIQAHLADNGTAGGNKRGTSSTDFQRSRTSSAQVASGNYSVICGGDQNITSSSYSFIGGGSNNSCSGIVGVISGGGTNVVGSTAYGGTISGGQANSVSSRYGTIPGGTGGNTRGVEGALVYGGAVGTQRQLGRYLLSCDETTNATLTRLTTNRNTTILPSNLITLPDNGSYRMNYTVVARNMTTGATASGEGKLLANRGATASTVALIGAPTFSWDFATSGFTLPAITISADTTNGAIDFSVTGLASTTIRWLIVVQTVEVAN